MNCATSVFLSEVQPLLLLCSLEDMCCMYYLKGALACKIQCYRSHGCTFQYCRQRDKPSYRKRMPHADIHLLPSLMFIATCHMAAKSNLKPLDGIFSSVSVAATPFRRVSAVQAFPLACRQRAWQSLLREERRQALCLGRFARPRQRTLQHLHGA